MLVIRGPSIVASNGTIPPVWSAKTIHYTQVEVVKVQVRQFWLNDLLFDEGGDNETYSLDNLCCVCWIFFRMTRLKTLGKLMLNSCKQTNDDGWKMMILPRCQVANHSVLFSVSTRYLISEYVLFSLWFMQYMIFRVATLLE